MTAFLVMGGVSFPGVPFSFPVFSPLFLLLLALAPQFHTQWMPLSFFSRRGCQGRTAQSNASSSAWRTGGCRPSEGPPRGGVRPPAVLPPSAPYPPRLSHLRHRVVPRSPGALKSRGPGPASGAVAQFNALPSAGAAWAGPGPCWRAPGEGPFPPAFCLPRWVSFSQAAPEAESRGRGDQGTAGQGRA